MVMSVIFVLLSAGAALGATYTIQCDPGDNPCEGTQKVDTIYGTDDLDTIEA